MDSTLVRTGLPFVTGVWSESTTTNSFLDTLGPVDDLRVYFSLGRACWTPCARCCGGDVRQLRPYTWEIELRHIRRIW